MRSCVHEWRKSLESLVLLEFWPKKGICRNGFQARGISSWNRDGQSWFTGGVDAAISYGGTMNLYVKDGIVRAIEIGG